MRIDSEESWLVKPLAWLVTLLIMWLPFHYVAPLYWSFPWLAATFWEFSACVIAARFMFFAVTARPMFLPVKKKEEAKNV